MEHLETARTVAEPGGLIRSFVDLLAPMATLMRHLLEHRPGQSSFAYQVFEACLMALPKDQRAKPAEKEQQTILG